MRTLIVFLFCVMQLNASINYVRVKKTGSRTIKNLLEKHFDEEQVYGLLPGSDKLTRWGIRELFQKLGLPQPDGIPHRNSTTKQPVDSGTVEKIRKLNALDIRLYEYAKEHYGRKS